MEKCINCVYFFSCEKANEERICEKYKFERKEVQKKKVEKGIMNAIEKESKKMQIANLFYEICPHVPPQILATTVNQTMKNFEELEQLYSPNHKAVVKRDYSDDRIDSLRYAIEEMKKLSKDTIIGKPETATEIKLMQEYENHIPRI